MRDECVDCPALNECGNVKEGQICQADFDRWNDVMDDNIEDDNIDFLIQELNG